MERILFLASPEPDGSLSRISLETLNAAVALAQELAGAELVIGLIGESVAGAAESIGSAAAKRWLSAESPAFAAGRYATDTAAAEAICRAADPTVVIAPASSRWSRALPGVAHRLSGRIDTHISGLAVANGQLTISRWYYRQRMEAAIQRTPRPWCLLLDSGNRPAWSGTPAKVSPEAVPVELKEAHQRTQVTGVHAPAADAQTIRPDADLLFVAGAGWTKKQADGQVHLNQAADLILGFVQQTKSSLGSSKSLVDLSSEGQAVLPFLTHLNQVGQTGSTPRHPKGLATCCHGEEPHSVGWRFVHERRAVNLDPNCGWARGKADVVYVGDAFQVMSEVNALLVAHPK